MSISKLLSLTVLASIALSSGNVFAAGEQACEASCKVIKAHHEASSTDVLEHNWMATVRSLGPLDGQSSVKALKHLAAEKNLNPVLLKKLTSCYPLPATGANSDDIASIMLAAQFVAGVSAGVASCSGNIGN